MKHVPAPSLLDLIRCRRMAWTFALVAPLLLAPLGATAQPAAGPATAESALWAEVRDSQRPGDLQAYLDAFPAGTYAPLARRRLQALGPAPAGLAAPAQPGPAQAVAAVAPVPAQDCDRLAEPGRKSLGKGDAWFGPGVRDAQMDAPAARAACARAMAQFPGEARFAAYAAYAAEVAKDNAEAVRLYRLAAERGNAFGQWNVAYTLLYGDLGVPRDAAGGMHWLRLAVGQGVLRAQEVLGWVLAKDAEGVPANPEEGVRLLRLAAAAGGEEAQYNLGFLAVTGEAGVPQDYMEGARWYCLAIEGGNEDAPGALGFLHASGLGVAQDDVEGVRLFRVGVERGSADAQNRLGTMYEIGRGGLAKNAAALEAVKKLEAAAPGRTP